MKNDSWGVGKKVLGGVLAAIMGLGLFSGCDGGNKTTKSSKDSNDDVELKIASVNNDDLFIMADMAKEFTKETGIKVAFTMLSENEIRSKIIQDVSMGSGGYDLVTLGADMGSYLDNQWVVALDPMFQALPKKEQDAYDLSDIMKSGKEWCSSKTKGLAAIPIYLESTMICYNKDLFKEKGLVMPENPTWEQIYELAAKAQDKNLGISGIAIRGLSGWGENLYIFGSIMYAFGGQYYDMDWNATYDTPEVRNALKFYKKLMTVAEASPTTCGYTECLNLFAQGKAAIYYDATVSAGKFAAADSVVKGKVGYAEVPTAVKKNNGTLGGWAMAISTASKHKDAAFKFLRWATSKEYIKAVQQKYGFAKTPSGTRYSTYANPAYEQACDFAEMTKNAIANADVNHPAIRDTPYTGNATPNLPEFSSWGETIAGELAAYISGNKSLHDMISSCQKTLQDAAIDGGYKKK